MALRDIGWGGMACIHLTQDRDQLRAFVNLYSSPDMIRMIKYTEDEMARACSTRGEEERI
jgi:hypothetical protein